MRLSESLRIWGENDYCPSDEDEEQAKEFEAMLLSAHQLLLNTGFQPSIEEFCRWDVDANDLAYKILFAVDGIKPKDLKTPSPESPAPS